MKTMYRYEMKKLLSQKVFWIALLIMTALIVAQGSGVKEFYTLPVGRELLQYESIAVNTIVKNKTGEVSSCDVPFNTSLAAL